MKKNIVITILAVLVVGLGCTLGYVLLNNSSDDNTNKEENKEEVVEKEEKDEEQDSKKEESKETKQEANTIETRTCTGKYSGAVEGPHSPGTLEVELKSNGTYLVSGYEMGTYKIIENALLTITPPDACAPGGTCYASYAANTISDDCNTILWTYNSNRFELTKQN